MSPGTIRSLLIIDDDETLTEGLKRLLYRNGYAVHTARNGKEALEFLAAEQVDLVITDIFMEEMEGLETLVAVKRHYPEIQIIAMSGGAKIMDRDCLDMAQVLGADKILRKPIIIHTLLDTIKELSSRLTK